jgi:hypothetical protein
MEKSGPSGPFSYGGETSRCPCIAGVEAHFVDDAFGTRGPLKNLSEDASVLLKTASPKPKIKDL